MGIKDMKRNLNRQQQRNVPKTAAFIKNLLGHLSWLVGWWGGGGRDREKIKGKKDFVRAKGRL